MATSTLLWLAVPASAWAQPAPGAVRDLPGGVTRAAAGQTGVGRASDGVLDRQAGSGGDVSYGGGPVLTSNRTHIIFWQPSGSKLTFDQGYRPLMQSFLTDVAAASHSPGNLFALTGQYTDSAKHPAAYDSTYAGALLDTDRLPLSQCTEPPGTGPGWSVCLTDSQLQSEIEHIVQARRLPTTQRDVYFLVTPRGLGSCMGYSPTSGCALGGSVNGYCGYHQFTSNDEVDYAFIPYNAVPGHCQSSHPRPNGSTADPALSTMAHELAEMVTDPDGDAWTDGSGNEVADLCITTFGPAIGGSGSRRYNQSINGGHFYLQDLWSNAAGRCDARARPDHVSFSVTGRSGLTVSFKGSGRDPEGHIASFRWDFGDGELASGQSVSHRFARGGEYSVQLRITDSWDNWATYTRTVPVS